MEAFNPNNLSSCKDPVRLPLKKASTPEPQHSKVLVKTKAPNPKLLCTPITKIHINYLSYINIRSPSYKKHLPTSKSPRPIAQKYLRQRQLNSKYNFFSEYIKTSKKFHCNHQMISMANSPIAKKRNISEEL